MSEKVGIPISEKENKRIQLEILLHFDDFCKTHHLRYFLSDGTLIGAIRHKGFIPWDDDIDVIMPRPDWLKLSKLFVNQGFYNISSPCDKNSRFHNIKIYDNRTIKIEQGVKYNDDYLGIDIDVFALDGSPDNQIEYERIREKINRLFNRSCTIKCGLSGSWKHKLRVLLYRLFWGNPDVIMKKALRLCETVSFDESNFATRYGRFGLGGRVPISCYKDAISVDFEGFCFPVPCGFDEVLKSEYGDYMKMPPENERVTHHCNAVYWKSN